MKPEDVAVGKRYIWTGTADGTPTVVTVSDVDTGEHGIAAACVSVTRDNSGEAAVALLADFAAAATAAPPWDCEAYGVEITAVGGWCFFGGDHYQRICQNALECAGRMIVERGRAFSRIKELADAGDPTGVYLAAQFTDPRQLLGGGAPDPQPAGDADE